MVALLSLDGLGPATVLACSLEGGAARVWRELQAGRGRRIDPIASAVGRRKDHDPARMDRLERSAAALDAETFLRRHEAAGQRVVRYGQADYPERLLVDPAPPPVLFLQGASEVLAGPTVAIVGTRNATHLGRETAGRLAAELSERGVSVVSGLALGIDAAAHQAVVGRAAGGRAVGVIATGLERAYPRRHQVLHRQVAANGILVTESPIGSDPARWRFPARNRVIAGLSDAVVVVESRSAGGSMLTAAEALLRDRPVLAVPGHPTSAAAAGTLDLIADGAAPVRDVEDVMVAIGLGGQKPTAAAPEPAEAAPLGDVARCLLEALEANPRTLGELVAAGAVDLDAASEALLELERSGLVIRSGAWFERSGSPVEPTRSGRRR
jgi:DNA processing protein